MEQENRPSSNCSVSEYWASSGQVTVLGTRFGEGVFLSYVSVLGSLAPSFQKDCQNIF